MRLGKHLRGSVVGLVWVIAAVGTAPALAKTVYVSKTGNNTHDGLTWSTAKLTVQEGLNAAVADDQVWVAAGTYVENITLTLGVALYGGFAGDETDLSQRHWATNKTILDGNQAGSVVTSPSGATATTRIDGFTIRNGIGTVSGVYLYGGGVYCSSSSPTIANNLITDNIASSGGGIHCDSASPTIVNNTITGNRVSGVSIAYGGGIFCSRSSSPTIEGNVISSNVADNAYGGGICSEGSATIANNAIIANTASGPAGGYGGGIASIGSTTIANNTICGNTGSSDGGGIYCYGSSPLAIANTIVAFNSSGICKTGTGTLLLQHNCVFGNSAYNYTGISDPTGTNGNLSVNPGVAGWKYGHWHIQSGSPCVGAGDNALVPLDARDLDGDGDTTEPLPFDLDGQPRIQGQNGTVDIGADESDGTDPPSGPNVIVRVSPDGDDANDGSSWALAKRTVQGGIDAASESGGEVWVKTGTYPERIALRVLAHVYGGFGGTEETRYQRDFRSNTTVLDGQQGGSVVTAQLAGYGVSTVDGFTIRNGTGTLSGGSSAVGGGIYCSFCSPTIANNTITENTASSGGGIHCNRASPTIVDNQVSGNAASSYGGGICCGSSSPTIAGNVISGNATVNGGGIYCASSSPVITNNTITANSTPGVGGGISCYSGSATISNNIIAFNSTGIHGFGGPPLLQNNCVYNPSGSNYSGLSAGTGDISVDPRLVAVDYGEVHLTAESPCRDAGLDSAVQSGWVDIDGEARIQGEHVDVGADEFNGAAPPFARRVVRVSPSGDDANDGSSWASAKRTVQAGIDAAGSHGGEVWVQAGIYYERITLHAFAYVYGGFDGTEIANDERDYATNATVLDGQRSGTVVTSVVGFHVSTIDGFAVRNGSETLSSYKLGAGIYCRNSAPTIANNTIAGNTAVSGGGIYCVSSSATITNNVITGNSVRGSSSISAVRGGAIYCEGGSPRIANNTVTGNSVSGPSYVYGGGIYCSGSATITNNTITGNSVSGSSHLYGGGIYCAGYATITNNTITGNSVSGSSDVCAGGIYVYQFSPTIACNTIAGNTAVSGGGIYCSSSSPTIANNTITANVATFGGGIHCSSSASPMIANTIVAFNSSGIYNHSLGTPVLRYNCVFGNSAYNYSGVTDPTGTNGNISADPRLANLAYGNMHTQPNSPCVGAGDDAAVQAGWLDIDGQLRIIGAHVDIGADESDGTLWPVGPYTIVRVSPTGDDANDGSSWVTAKRTVQAAIDAAAPLGGEVWVQAGTYNERITLHPLAHVYGGFSGTETARDSRKWGAHVTVLDGQQGGSVVTARAGHRVSTIDGFIIRNGTGTQVDSAWYGGGLYCRTSSPTIANNTIIANSASAGGGVYFDFSSPTITNNAIMGNTGGGIGCGYASPTIANNMVMGNTSIGIRCDYASPTIANNMVMGNTDSGIFCVNSFFSTIANNTITGNSGGGIYCVSSPSSTIANTIVAFNSSGIWGESSTLALRSNCVYGNSAYDYDGITDPTGTDGNISADPGLADIVYGNMHIQADSPCIDAGDDAVIRAGWLDIDGESRIVASHVDIGADESDGTTWPDGPYAVVRVSPDGNDANDGSSWVSAKRTVQAGIDAGARLGGEVWVQAGVYYERITLHPFAHAYGGFAGTEIARNERNWTTSPTILDGQQGGSVVTVQTGSTDSTIDGFTIRNGTGTLWDGPTCGGGLYCYYGSPTIANCTITGNGASSGGGVYCYYGSPTIANCTIARNSASYSGGGLCCDYSSPTITNCTFGGNSAADSGGGILCFSSSPMIANCTITGNSVSYDGGGIFCVVSSSTIANCSITGNIASYGGGISFLWDSSMIANTIVAFNSPGIRQYSGSDTPVLRYNCVFGNTTYNYSEIADPTGVDGNISADPLFVRLASAGVDGQWGTIDDDYGDLRLQLGSPCIDAGDNAAVPTDTLDLDGDGDITEPIPFDLAGMARFMDDPRVADTGLGTPPIVDMGAYEYVPVPALQLSVPADGQSLWRNQKNIIRLTFDADIVDPDAGAVMIQEMLAGGTYGTDLSAGFTFTVENDGQGQPRVLKIQETGSTLQHRKWYAVGNTGDWAGVAPFTVQYVVQVGDATNDGRVLNTDFGLINAAIPTFNAADDDRRDINGDGRILNTDFGVLNSKIPSFPVVKPSGH